MEDVVVEPVVAGAAMTLVGAARVEVGGDDTGAIIEPAPGPPLQAASEADSIAKSANAEIWFLFTLRFVGRK